MTCWGIIWPGCWSRETSEAASTWEQCFRSLKSTNSTVVFPCGRTKHSLFKTTDVTVHLLHNMTPVACLLLKNNKVVLNREKPTSTGWTLLKNFAGKHEQYTQRMQFNKMMKIKTVLTKQTHEQLIYRDPFEHSKEHCPSPAVDCVCRFELMRLPVQLFNATRRKSIFKPRCFRASARRSSFTSSFLFLEYFCGASRRRVHIRRRHCSFSVSVFSETVVFTRIFLKTRWKDCFGKTLFPCGQGLNPLNHPDMQDWTLRGSQLMDQQQLFTLIKFKHFIN